MMEVGTGDKVIIDMREEGGEDSMRGRDMILVVELSRVEDSW